jgi:hypothetical protein
VPEVWRIALDQRLGMSIEVVERLTLRQLHQTHAIQAMLHEQAIRAEAARQHAAAQHAALARLQGR